MSNLKKVIVCISILIILIFILIYFRDTPFRESHYDYSEEVKLKNDIKNQNSVQSNEDTSVVYTKSSIFYNINSLKFSYDKESNEIIDLDKINTNENSPLIVESIQHKNNGIFIIFEFKESGAVTDFSMNVSIDGNNYVVKEDAIDCSAKFAIYIPCRLTNSVTEIILSEFNWKEFNNFSQLNMDFDNNNFDKTVKKVSEDSYQIKGNDYNLLFNVGYNSVNIKHKFNLLSGFFSNKDDLLIIFIKDNIQIGSAKISLNELDEKSISVGNNFNKIKIIKEENHG